MKTLHVNNKLLRQRQGSGFTLIELMVAMLIGSIVIAAGISLYRTSLAQNHSVNYTARLQEESFFISHVLKQQIAQIGYRPIDRSRLDGRIMPIDDRATAFPEEPGVWEKGQTISLTGNTLTYRYYGASNDALTADLSIYDCLGNPVEEGTVISNQIAFSDNKLVCSTGSDSSVIIGAEEKVIVENVIYEIGVDDDGDNIVDRSIDASTAAGSDFTNAKQLNMRLLLATPDWVANDKRTYFYNDSEFTATDRRLRLESEISMALRN